MIVLSVMSYVGTATSNDFPVPKLCSSLYGGLPPILPVSIPLPRFADKNFVPSPVRSSLVATQQYPSSPDTRISTICVDLDAFSSKCSRSSDCHPSVSPVGIDRVSVSSVDSGDNGKTDVSPQLSRLQPLNRSHSPVDISSDSQVVVESPSHYEVPAVPVNISAFVESVVQLPYH